MGELNGYRLKRIIKSINVYLKSIFLGSVILILATSCGKTVVPVAAGDKPEKGFDTVIYNIALVEGARNKMNGNAGEAISFYQRAFSINPESGVAPYEISTILFLRGDSEGALVYGRKAIENDPTNIWYLNNLANLFFSVNLPDSAIIQLERIVELYPEEEETLFNLAGLYIAEGEPAKGETILRGFRVKYGNDEKIVYSLLNALNEQKKVKETEELLKEMSVKYPDDTAYKGMLAELYRETGREAEATKIYSSLLEKDPDNPVLMISYLDYLFEEKRFEEMSERLNGFMINDSIEISDKVGILTTFATDSVFMESYGHTLIVSAMLLEANHPGNREVMLAIASLYALKGETDQEILKLKEVTELFPRDYPTREKLLLKLNETGQNQELFNFATRVAREFNVYPLPKLLLAWAANELGKYEAALEELKKVRILINENPDFMMQILLLEADIYYNMKKYELSWSSYEEALLLDPDDALVLNNYAYFLAEQNQELNKAANMVQKALRVEKNVTYIDTWAWILYKQGKNRKALRLMKEVIATGNNDPEIMEHFGYMLYKAGNCDEARQYWKQALNKDPAKTYLLEEIEKCTK
jgi:tetratricopeptide (TPR) repeat protein